VSDIKVVARSRSRPHDRGYLYSRSTAAVLLKLDVAVALAAGLTRLMPAGPERDNLDRAFERAEARRRMTLRRRSAGIAARPSGDGQAPWIPLNISKSHYYKHRSFIEQLTPSLGDDQPEG
jgi:hypothetical protein